jgi:hypothetical protein
MIVFSVLFRRSLWLAGVGIILLYGIAIYEYGLFHLLDYMIFIGLAIYLILSTKINNKTLKHFKHYRLPILYSGLVFSFLWSAIEKMAYPEWFYPLLEKNIFITMGLDVDFFIALMAFVEFSLFFLLIISRNLTSIIALILNVIIMSGNIYFGKMDAIGHFITNFILVIIFINGSLNFKFGILTSSKKYFTVIAGGVLIYITFLTLFLVSYYKIHQIYYQ